MKDKSKDELYGWTEREFPGTKQYTAAMLELDRRKKRDNRIRLLVGLSIALLVALALWIRNWWGF